MLTANFVILFLLVLCENMCKPQRLNIEFNEVTKTATKGLTLHDTFKGKTWNTLASDDETFNYENKSQNKYDLDSTEEQKASKFPFRHNETIIDKKVGLHKPSSLFESYKNESDDLKTSETREKLNSTVEGEGLNITFDERKREDAFNVTTPEENPYSVLLILMSNNKAVAVCTGSILTDQWVLTAAHCVYSKKMNINSVQVYAGGNSLKELADKKLAVGSQLFKSVQIYPHPKYSERNGYDVGLVKIDGKFNLTKTVNTIKLSSQPWTYHSYYNCKFTGFGIVQIDQKSAEDEVRKTHSLLVKNPCLCSFRLKMLLGSNTAKGFICTKPKEDYGVCPGDSGGGLVCDGQIKAVASQIIKLKNMETCDIGFMLLDKLRCGSRTTLSIFEDTCPFVRWINSHVKLFEDSEISPKCVEKKGHGVKFRPQTAVVIFFVIINIFFL